VKQPQSNPLLKELARATTPGAHPDADLLTACAEGTLLLREKQEVLAHLAACAACREILGAAQASAPATASGPAAVRLRPARPVRMWLPWAGTATALLFVSLSILLYQQHAARHEERTIAKDTIPRTPPLATPQLPAAPPAREKTDARRDELDRGAKKADRLAAPAPAASMATPQSRQPASLGAPSQQVQNNDALQNVPAAQSDGRSQQQAAGKEMAGNEIQQGNNAQQTLRSDEVAGQSQASQAPVAGEMHGSSAAFVQAEPQRAMAKVAVAGVVRPHWRINAAGQAERSFGNGPWQAVLQQETSRMRVISVSGDQIWIGGDHGRLYRSADEGATWTQVVLPEKDGADHAIVHIRFEAPGNVTVEASDGVSWTSKDNGATWN